MQCLNLNLVPSFAVYDSWSRHIGNFVAIPPYFFYLFAFISFALIHIYEYLNYKICIFYHFDQMAMYQLLVDTKFCKIGYLSASVVLIL